MVRSANDQTAVAPDFALVASAVDPGLSHDARLRFPYAR
jgi:hypothetical protein